MPLRLIGALGHQHRHHRVFIHRQDRRQRAGMPIPHPNPAIPDRIGDQRHQHPVQLDTGHQLRVLGLNVQDRAAVLVQQQTARVEQLKRRIGPHRHGHYASFPEAPRAQRDDPAMHTGRPALRERNGNRCGPWGGRGASGSASPQWWCPATLSRLDTTTKARGTVRRPSRTGPFRRKPPNRPAISRAGVGAELAAVPRCRQQPCGARSPQMELGHQAPTRHRTVLQTLTDYRDHRIVGHPRDRTLRRPTPGYSRPSTRSGFGLPPESTAPSRD